MSEDDIRALCVRVPGVSDHLLLELVNGLEVSKDILRSECRGSVFAGLRDVLTGATRRRQLRVSENLVVGQSAIIDLVVELAGTQEATAYGLMVTAEHLGRLRAEVGQHDGLLRLHARAIHEIAAALETLECKWEERFARVELRLAAADELDIALSYVQDRDRYGGMAPLVRCVLVARQALAGAIPKYEEITSRSEHSSRLRRELSSKLEDWMADDHRLDVLLDGSTQTMSRFDLELASELTLAPYGERIDASQNPYLNTVGTALQLASLPEHLQPRTLGETAILLTRRQGGAIDSTFTPKFIVEEMVSELTTLARRGHIGTGKVNFATRRPVS